jgi:hypothetical protein
MGDDPGGAASSVSELSQVWGLGILPRIRLNFTKFPFWQLTFTSFYRRGYGAGRS